MDIFSDSYIKKPIITSDNVIHPMVELDSGCMETT
ncbi:hypothetical protein J2756_001262 [Methanobacterium aggregans]|uniref:Uncharacterized protein n=1 Tax=Methanobacterium congolense TaxID=118062 RepID=A0A1D3KYZ6_9EURY|nr:hypothetical protein [Methanobacterium aggregans]SCG84601.1 hypothetical protein MCBB_0012 [Methanobacterium congolense]